MKTKSFLATVELLADGVVVDSAAGDGQHTLSASGLGNVSLDLGSVLVLG